MSEIVYRLADKSDEQAVLEHLREHFYEDEPLFKHDGYHDVEDEQFSVGLIKHGTCTVAVSNSQIVGVLLSYPEHKGSKDTSAVVNKKPSTAFEIIKGILNALNAQSDAFDRYGVDEIMKAYVASVHRDFRGKGIAQRLFEENMQLAKSKGFPVYICDCTSFFSAKLCEKLGMELIAELKFSEYCDDNGNAYYAPEAPHDVATSYAKRL